jgi:GNAT superfamily N-acetyltransferase
LPLDLALRVIGEMMKVHLLESEADLPAIAEVLLQLRPQYTKDLLIEQIKKQERLGYKIAYIKADGNILCVAGFVVGEKIAWGKHIYIDDLVTNETYRSTGVGAFIINWFKSYCKELGCKQLHLDSGIQKFSAHRFYLNNRFNIASHHFSITDIGS